MENRHPIRTGYASSADALTAAGELHTAIAQPEAALVLFFCSSHYDLDVLAAEIRRLFGDTQVVGCTTAGEFSPAGCRDRSISGVSFGAGSCVAVSGRIDDLQQFEDPRGRALADELLQRLERADSGVDDGNSFALLLIDGSSVREEPVTRSLQNALGQIPLVGGSAGDGLNFGSTHVYSNGAFESASAVLVLVSTQLPFETFKTQHVDALDERLVVTAADPEHRLVTEIDGMPAAEGYARAVGAKVDSLDPLRFAAQPMVVVIDGTDYVRSIQKANPDGSLTFFCAIEEGLVLRLARCGNLVEDLENTLADVQAAIGPPQVVIGCDCILRKLEVSQRDLTARVNDVYRDYNVVGFNSYGEQYHGVHVNQTFTGIAIGGPRDDRA